MRLTPGMNVCGWAIVGLMSAGTAWADDGQGSIVGWGLQVVGGNQNTDFVAVAAGKYHSLGIKGYPHGDLDRDRDVDLDDFVLLPECLDGPDVPFPPGRDADDLDVDADLGDFGLYQTLFTDPRWPLSSPARRSGHRPDGNGSGQYVGATT